MCGLKGTFMETNPNKGRQYHFPGDNTQSQILLTSFKHVDSPKEF